MPEPITAAIRTGGATAERRARCAYYSGCGVEAASGPRLAFFEALGPGRTDDECRVCHYKEIAHERFSGRLMDGVAAGRWPRGVVPHSFVARTEGHPYDRFYCGCRGWD